VKKIFSSIGELTERTNIDTAIFGPGS